MLVEVQLRANLHRASIHLRKDIIVVDCVSIRVPFDTEQQATERSENGINGVNLA